MLKENTEEEGGHCRRWRKYGRKEDFSEVGGN